MLNCKVAISFRLLWLNALRYHIRAIDHVVRRLLVLRVLLPRIIAQTLRLDLNLVTLTLPVDSTLHLWRLANGTISNLVSCLANLVCRDLRLTLDLWIAPSFI